MGPITPITTQIAFPSVTPATGSPQHNGEFQNLLSASLENVESQRAQSHQAVQEFLSGETEDVHKVALAAQRAELSSEMFLQIRNKVVSAYQEIMRMQM